MARPANTQKEGDMEMMLTLSLLKDKQNEVNAVGFLCWLCTHLLFVSLWLNCFLCEGKAYSLLVHLPFPLNRPR